MNAWKVWTLTAGALLLAAGPAWAQAPVPVNLERGAAMYTKHCAVCHGDRGDGQQHRRQ